MGDTRDRRRRRQTPTKPDDKPDIHERVQPLPVDRFGQVASPIAPGPKPGCDVQAELRYFKDRWKFDEASAVAAVNNGWTRADIEAPLDYRTCTGGLLASCDFYEERVGKMYPQSEKRFKIVITDKIDGDRPISTSYDTKGRTTTFEFNPAHRENSFPSVARRMDWLLIHEVTHHIQYGLWGMDQVELITKNYQVGDRPRFAAELGIKGWDRQFGMPPLYISQEQEGAIQRVIQHYSLDPESFRKEIARHSRDLHADSIALGHEVDWILLTDEEKAAGLTKETKILAEYLLGSWEVVPSRPIAENLPLYGRFRAVCNAVERVASGLKPEERNALERQMGKFISVPDGTSAIAHVGQRFDQTLEAGDEGLTPVEWDAYTSLTAAYTSHLMLCLNRREHMPPVEEIARGLDDPDQRFRTRVVEYLGERGDVKALDILIGRLEDESETKPLRLGSIRAIGDIGRQNTLRPELTKASSVLCNKLDDPDDDVRDYSLRALIEIGDVNAVPILVNTLMITPHNHYTSRRGMIQGIERIVQLHPNDVDLSHVLGPILEDYYPLSMLYPSVKNTLSNIAPLKKLVPALAENLTRGAEGSRWGAALRMWDADVSNFIVENNLIEAVAALAKALSDDSRSVRRMAAHSLGGTYVKGLTEPLPFEALEDLVKALGGEDPIISETDARLMFTQGLTIGESEYPTSEAAAETLSNLHDSRAIPLLEKAMVEGRLSPGIADKVIKQIRES